MKLLITGSNGLLGQKIVKLCLKRGVDFIATSQGENRNSACPQSQYLSLDITNEQQVKEVFSTQLPTHVIHTAAMTNVDQCENEPENCRLINVQGTRYLFEAAQRLEAHFELLSTDFVFDGEKGNYVESDPVNPLSIYAQSKVDAERILLESNYANWSIARTIIVYGTAEKLSRTNIVLWAREALKKGNDLNIVDDQFRSPTWAEDLAWGCLEIVNRNKTGIYHLSGPKTYSILNLVKEIAKYYKLSTDFIKPVSSATLDQAAKRPPKTGFDLSKARKDLDYKPMDIHEALEILEEELA